MKKLITLILALALVASLSGCFGGTVSETETNAPDNLTEATETVNEDNLPIEGENVSSSEGIDVASAATETSVEAPANVGQWIKSVGYSATSGEYETIYWRIVNTTFDCQAEIDRYKAEGGRYSFEPSEYEELTYCLVNYEVYFPKDFHASEDGINSLVTEIPLKVKGLDGSSTIKWNGSSYIGLSMCYDISVDQEIKPGDVFKGQCVFEMINDPEVEYIFEVGHMELGPKESESHLVYDYSKAK